MTEEFKNALSDFAFDVACRRAIRHLCDLGYSPEQIKSRLDYPVSIERIRKETEEYKSETDSVRSGETKEYTIIKETGKYGKTSFRRVLKS